MQIKHATLTQPHNGTRMDTFLPSLLSFAPLLIIMDLANVHVERGPLALIVSLLPYGGAILLAIGLNGLYIRQTQILSRLDELEKSRTPTL